MAPVSLVGRPLPVCLDPPTADIWADELLRRDEQRLVRVCVGSFTAVGIGGGVTLATGWLPALMAGTAAGMALLLLEWRRLRRAVSDPLSAPLALWLAEQADPTAAVREAVADPARHPRCAAALRSVHIGRPVVSSTVGR